MRIRYRIGAMPGPWPAAADAAFLWKLIDLCESSDLDSLWFSERLSSSIPVPEPVTTMAALAARTRRLKFGPSVLVAPYRSPVVAARELAMIDWMSEGRLLPAFGIGVELEREFAAAGVPYKERARRTDEAIAIMRRCWAEDEVSFAGEFWQLDRITVLPKPRQRPLPLWIGGNSEAAMRRAGRLGDGWIPSVTSPARVREGIAIVQSAAAAAGREVPEDHFGALVFCCLDRDRTSAAALAAPYLPRGRADEATLAACSAFGPPALLIERLEAYVAAGASKFIVRPLCPPDRMLEQLGWIAADVVPEFHRR